MPSEPEDSLRGTVLTYLITGTMLAFLLLVGIVILGQIVLPIAGLVLLGFLHYLLWGKMLTKEVAGEREEHELLRRVEEDDSDYSRHFRE